MCRSYWPWWDLPFWSIGVSVNIKALLFFGIPISRTIREMHVGYFISRVSNRNLKLESCTVTILYIYKKKTNTWSHIISLKCILNLTDYRNRIIKKLTHKSFAMFSWPRKALFDIWFDIKSFTWTIFFKFSI